MRGNDKPGARAVAFGGDAFDCVSGNNCVRSEALDDRLVQQHLQVPAMHRKLRPPVAGVDPARLAPDPLAELVVVREFGCADRGGVEAAGQPEIGQYPDRVRQQVDSDSERTDPVYRFVDDRVDADPMQAERRGQSADAGADDNCLHAVASHSISCNEGIIEYSIAFLVPEFPA